MYQLKSVARRIVLLIPALGMLGAVSYQAIMPSVSLADALNPLTQRSLLLTSSSPGWAYLDGSGDSQYAQPGQGPNGQKTGETFTFNTSTNSTGGGTAAVKAFTFQYCTTAAGDCIAPGDDMDELGSDPGNDCLLDGSTAEVNADANYVCAAGSAPYWADDASHTDLNVVSGGANTTSYPITAAGSGWSEGGTVTSGVPATTAGDFQIYLNTGTHSSPVWTASSGWTMTEANVEDQTDIVTGDPIDGQTGANNFITLTKSGGIDPAAGEEIEVQFQPNANNYITNPGQDSFFVKINDYNSATVQNWADNIPYTSGGAADVLDGGVTVAQVMNQSIEIQTKVLETMDFSVGTVDPDTLTPGELSTDTGGAESAHGECDSILPDDAGDLAPANPSPDTLLMGNPEAQYSLSPSTPYDTTSMFRVSTNAANGATVYYSGNTLADTEDNEIAPMVDSPTSDDAAYADTGTEQFGLGLEYTNTGGNLLTNEALDSTFETDVATENTAGNAYWYYPTLSPLAPTASYGDANGTLASGSGPKFAFNSSANSTPVPIATEDTTVVDCSTGMVRYVADIAPSTPAGIYTTAINYLAAPEY